jgi:preprotein translocase subunit SecF
VFELLKNPNFDFMGKRKIFLVISGILLTLSVAQFGIKGFNRGIEFTGGTELQLKYADSPELSEIRSKLGTSAQVTRIGLPEENEIYIKIGATEEQETLTTESTTEVIDKLRQPRPGFEDLNSVDSAVLSRVLMDTAGVDATTASAASGLILTERKERAIFHSLEEVKSIPGLAADVQAALDSRTYVGPFSLRSQSFIGPAIGRELLSKAGWAIFGSLLGMMIYIWIRFQIQWGLAAVVALSHDTIITLGLLSLFDKELSLPVVAAFLTLVGYSVNDTVVVFDRIRENIRAKGTTNMVETVNRSINQTLSRTLITTGSTWVVVFGLFMFGGEALNPFAFVLTAGIVVGTYSSIFIASPFLLMWQEVFKKGQKRIMAKKRTA